jgi:segregation and condensation protein B
MEQEQLSSVVESILFVADRPVPRARLMEILGEEIISEQELNSLIAGIQEKYNEPYHGFELREAQGGFHFCTKVANAEWIRKFLATKPFRLSRTALETLAIIAYRQPVTRAEIDKIRGIDSSHLMRVLIERGLVKMAGKADVPGRPVQYGTTPRFLEVTGLQSLNELPPLSELDQLQGNTEAPVNPLEQGLERFIANKVAQAEAVDDDEGLKQIEGMLDTAGRGDREIFESSDHAEVARENEAALEGLLAFLKPHRRSRAKKNETEIVDSDAVEAMPMPETVPGEEALPEADVELLAEPVAVEEILNEELPSVIEEVVVVETTTEISDA